MSATSQIEERLQERVHTLGEAVLEAQRGLEREREFFQEYVDRAVETAGLKQRQRLAGELVGRRAWEEACVAAEAHRQQLEARTAQAVAAVEALGRQQQQLQEAMRGAAGSARRAAERDKEAVKVASELRALQGEWAGERSYLRSFVQAEAKALEEGRYSSKHEQAAAANELQASVARMATRLLALERRLLHQRDSASASPSPSSSSPATPPDRGTRPQSAMQPPSSAGVGSASDSDRSLSKSLLQDDEELSVVSQQERRDARLFPSSRTQNFVREAIKASIDQFSRDQETFIRQHDLQLEEKIR